MSPKTHGLSRKTRLVREKMRSSSWGESRNARGQGSWGALAGILERTPGEGRPELDWENDEGELKGWRLWGEDGISYEI